MSVSREDEKEVIVALLKVEGLFDNDKSGNQAHIIGRVLGTLLKDNKYSSTIKKALSDPNSPALTQGVVDGLMEELDNE